MHYMTPHSFDEHGVAHCTGEYGANGDCSCVSELGGLRQHDRQDIFQQVRDVLQCKLKRSSGLEEGRCQQCPDVLASLLHSQGVSSRVISQGRLELFELA